MAKHARGMTVRNPFLGMFASLAWTAVLATLLSLPVLLLAYLALPAEVSLFYRVIAFVLAGALAGRSGTFAFAAFPAAFLGGFVSYAAFTAVLTPPADLLFAAIHATIAGLAAWAVAIRVMARVTPEVLLENAEKRRCRMCGARVGPRARRCWSCRASLNRIT